MKMKKTLFTSALLATLVGMSACTTKEKEGEKKVEDKKEAAAAPEKETVLISVDTAIVKNVAQIDEVTATVKAYAKNDIAPQTPGRIVKIFTEVGNFVSKGQVLAKMDETSLINIKTQLANAEVDYNRVLSLNKAGGASQQQVDQAKMQLDVLKENFRNLQENVNLIAPISGVITARNYDSGDLYNGARPIVTINQINPVKILVNVSEGNFTKIKKGNKVDITIDTYAGEKFQGNVSIIYPTIDESTRSFPVEITIPNANSKIRPGMFARATFNLGTAKRVLVPDLAVQKQLGSGDHYVYVYENGRVRYAKVETGRRIDDKYEIISGVKENELIVVGGMAKLNDGMEVEVVEKQ